MSKGSDRGRIIVDRMMQESNEANDGLAARKITDGEWITVKDNSDLTYTWYHGWWDVDKPHQLGDVFSHRSEITEDQAAVFLTDVTS